MHNDDLGEEMAARQNDRHGNAPLRRGPDPDKVAKHLATGEDSLISAKAKDGFTKESPIRAFTEFRMSGTVAIGKGFRPSLAHLHTYLDAMEAKEGWTFVQILLPDSDAGDPTIMFHRKPVPARMPFNPKHEDDDFGVVHETPFLVEDDQGTQQVAYYSAGTWWQGHNDSGPDVQTEHPIVRVVSIAFKPGVAPGTHEMVRGGPVASINGVPVGDPINPAYYGGQACAEIIEYMPFNVGVAGKYVWRLGEKDSEDQECGKAAWYLDREIVLHSQSIAPRPVFGVNHLNIRWYKDMALPRIEARQMPMWRKALMMCLVEYTVSGQPLFLREALAALRNERRCDEIDCGRGLAI